MGIMSVQEIRSTTLSGKPEYDLRPRVFSLLVLLAIHLSHLVTALLHAKTT